MDPVKDIGSVEVNKMTVSPPRGKSDPDHEWVSWQANESRVSSNKGRRGHFQDAQISVLLSHPSMVHGHICKKDFVLILRDFIYVDHRLKFGYSLRQVSNCGLLPAPIG